MFQSVDGPVEEDMLFSMSLLRSRKPVPQNTVFTTDRVNKFLARLYTRSEASVLIELHPLLVPSAESHSSTDSEHQFLHVIETYSEQWLMTLPIHGPKPQPDHAKGLRDTMFTKEQKQKLVVEDGQLSPYIVQHDMYFPYFTTEVKRTYAILAIADRQNMHSMCIAARAIVQLSQEAGCPTRFHRRILGYSVSHNSEQIYIYGHYPEINGESVSYFRKLIASHNLWSDSGDSLWKCYTFVQNMDDIFLPMHIGRVMDLLEMIP